MKPLGWTGATRSRPRGVVERHRRRLEQAERVRLGLAVAADRRDLVLGGAQQDDLARRRAPGAASGSVPRRQRRDRLEASPASAVSLESLTCLSTQWSP